MEYFPEKFLCVLVIQILASKGDRENLLLKGIRKNLYKENSNDLSRYFVLSLWIVLTIFCKRISKYFINSLYRFELHTVKEESDKRRVKAVLSAVVCILSKWGEKVFALHNFNLHKKHVHLLVLLLVEEDENKLSIYITRLDS